MKNSRLLFGLAAIAAAVNVLNLITGNGFLDEPALVMIALLIGGCICESIERLPELLVAEEIPENEKERADA